MMPHPITSGRTASLLTTGLNRPSAYPRRSADGHCLFGARPRPSRTVRGFDSGDCLRRSCTLPDQSGVRKAPRSRYGGRIAVGAITMVGTVIVIVVLVASAANSANSSGWDRATHFGLDRSYYTSAFQLGEGEYQLSVFAAENGQPTKTAQQECFNAGNAGQVHACEAGFEAAMAAAEQ